MQTFRSALEDKLHRTDSQLYKLEHNILAEESNGAVTLLQVSVAVEDIVEVVTCPVA